MPIEFEDAAVVGANAFKDAVAVQQPVIEHVDGGVFVTAKCAAHINRPSHSLPPVGRISIMATTFRKQSQSVIGLFRALNVDASAVPRTRPLYRRIVELVERGVVRSALVPGFRGAPERELARSL